MVKELGGSDQPTVEYRGKFFQVENKEMDSSKDHTPNGKTFHLRIEILYVIYGIVIPQGNVFVQSADKIRIALLNDKDKRSQHHE